MSEDKKLQNKLRRRRTHKMSPSKPLLNEMLVQSRWEYGQLSSNTAGIISDAGISPSIASSSEYSTLTSLFTEVKLISCKVTFTPQINGSVGVTGVNCIIGTHMLTNLNNHPSPPLVVADVQNLDRKRSFYVGNYANKVFTYRMKVPQDLGFSNVSADAPVAPTPEWGSPGCVRIFGDHATVSLNYLVVWVETIHYLRGRQ